MVHKPEILTDKSHSILTLSSNINLNNNSSDAFFSFSTQLRYLVPSSNRRMDEENKKYRCSYPDCGKRFFHSTDMNRHQRTKHGASMKRSGRQSSTLSVYPGEIIRRGGDIPEFSDCDRQQSQLELAGLLETSKHHGTNVPISAAGSSQSNTYLESDIKTSPE